MTTALISHPHGLSLTTLSKPLASTPPGATPFSLPSRFPLTSTPRTAISPAGHVYLFTEVVGVVWEYDSRGRRKSEFDTSTGVGGIKEAIGMGRVDGKERVCCALTHGSGVVVMEKKDGKWAVADRLDVKEVTALAKSSDGDLVVVGNAKGELVVLDQVKGTRTIIDLSQSIMGAIPRIICFTPTSPTTLLIPLTSIPSLLMLDTSNPTSSREIRPFPKCQVGHISDISFSPVIEGPDGVTERGLCAVLRSESGEIGLVGVDHPENAAKIVDFGEELGGIGFLDGATLFGRTVDGRMLVKDLRSLGKDAVEIKLDQPIINIQTFPPLPRKARPSLAPSTASSTRRTPLGESRHTNTNIDTPPPVPSLPAVKPAQKGLVSPEQNIEKSRAVSAPGEFKRAPRFSSVGPRLVSDTVPSRDKQVRGIAASTSQVRLLSAETVQSRDRGTSTIIEEEGEESSTARRAPRRSASSSKIVSAMAGSSTNPQHPDFRDMPVLEEEDHDHADYDDDDKGFKDGIDLAWALRDTPTPSRTIPPQINGNPDQDVLQTEIMEDLRREIGRVFNLTC